MNKTIVIKKTDEEFRRLEGVVYEPFVEDSQGDWMTDTEIRKAAYEFMAELNSQNVDTSHDDQVVDAFIAESYIAKDGDPNYSLGTWVVVIKVDDNDLWNSIVSGEYGGLSLAGTAERVEDVPIPM